MIKDSSKLAVSEELTFKKKKIMNERRKTLLGITGVAAATAWHKPIIKSIVTPAHAQTSPPSPPPPPPPEDVCPVITTSDATVSPVSGGLSGVACSATFEILSGDASASLTIVSITPSALPADTTFDVQDLGTATDSSGPRISWVGPSVDAPSCNDDSRPIDDVTFTVTATCAAAVGMGQFSQTFSLNDVLGG